MHVNVPQYIDVEDKIAFGLTGKQLLWMAAMGAVLLVAYNLFDRELFYGSGVVIILVFATFAFYRPQGVSFLTFLGFAARFLLKPKNYVWKRDYVSAPPVAKNLHEELGAARTEPRIKKPTQGQLRKIAWGLDTKK